MHEAACYPQSFQILLDSFGDDNNTKLAAVTKADNNGRTALHEAVRYSGLKILLDLFSDDNNTRLAAVTLRLGIGLCHVLTNPGFAVVLGARAVVVLARGIRPDFVARPARCLHPAWR